MLRRCTRSLSMQRLRMPRPTRFLNKLLPAAQPRQFRLTQQVL